MVNPRRQPKRRSPRKPRNQMGQTPSNAYSRLPLVVSRQEAFPQALRVSLRYVQQTSATNVAGETGSQVFTINSAFAPGLQTTVGTKHQPKGYDQYSVFYNEYLVVRCKVTMVVPPLGSTGLTTGYAGITLSDTSGAFFSSVEDCLEDAKTTFRSFGAIGSKPTVVTKVWDLSREVLAGADVRTAISGVYGAAVSASPTDLWYASCTIGVSTDGGFLGTVPFLVQLDQEIIFLSRKNIAQS